MARRSSTVIQGFVVLCDAFLTHTVEGCVAEHPGMQSTWVTSVCAGAVILLVFCMAVSKWCIPADAIRYAMVLLSRRRASRHLMVPGSLVPMCAVVFRLVMAHDLTHRPTSASR
jgi:hypothetical protein